MSTGEGFGVPNSDLATIRNTPRANGRSASGTAAVPTNHLHPLPTAAVGSDPIVQTVPDMVRNVSTISSRLDHPKFVSCPVRIDPVSVVPSLRRQ